MKRFLLGGSHSHIRKQRTNHGPVENKIVIRRKFDTSNPKSFPDLRCRNYAKQLHRNGAKTNIEKQKKTMKKQKHKEENKKTNKHTNV